MHKYFDLCLAFVCENTDNTEGVEQEELPPETIEAMNYLKTKELSLPDMHQTSSHPTVSTRSAMAVPKTLTEKKGMETSMIKDGIYSILYVIRKW